MNLGIKDGEFEITFCCDKEILHRTYYTLIAKYCKLKWKINIISLVS